MDVCTVIVNFNGGSLLGRCIDSLVAEITGCSFEIILVDNASQDNSLAQIDSKYPFVRILRNDTNLGFAQANNQGIICSQGDLILLINNDAEVRKGAIRALVEMMLSDPRIGIVGPRLLNPDGSLQYSYGPFPSLFEVLTGLLLDKSERYYNRRGYEHSHDVEWLTGACLLLRRKMLDEIGMLDDRFFFNYEDVDLCKRAWASKWRCSYVSTAEVVHYRGISSRLPVVVDTVMIEKRRSQVLYFAKHHRVTSYCVIKGINLLYAVLQVILWAVVSAAGFPRSGGSPKSYLRLLKVLWNLSRKEGIAQCRKKV